LAFQTFDLSVYLMKVIPETRGAATRYLRFYLF